MIQTSIDSRHLNAAATAVAWVPSVISGPSVRPSIHPLHHLPFSGFPSIPPYLIVCPSTAQSVIFNSSIRPFFIFSLPVRPSVHHLPFFRLSVHPSGGYEGQRRWFGCFMVFVGYFSDTIVVSGYEGWLRWFGWFSGFGGCFWKKNALLWYWGAGWVG